jgi:hypothetical protein
MLEKLDISSQLLNIAMSIGPDSKRMHTLMHVLDLDVSCKKELRARQAGSGRDESERVPQGRGRDAIGRAVVMGSGTSRRSEDSGA